MTSFYNQRWERPFLTPSIAVELLTKTPYHARLKCPYYGDVEDKSSDAMNEGSIVDGMVLGRGPKFHVVYADSFRTKEAREERDAAIEGGKIPIKSEDYTRIKEAAEMAKGAIPKTVLDVINCGTIKERLFWESSGINCSTEPDIYDMGEETVLDLKRTKVTPTGHNWRRHAASMRYDIQAAAALEATGASRFGWIIVEADKPHCVVVHWATEAFIKVGQRDWNYAKSVWANCVETDVFPAYESEEIDPATWLLGDDDDITFTEEQGEES